MRAIDPSGLDAAGLYPTTDGLLADPQRSGAIAQAQPDLALSTLLGHAPASAVQCGQEGSRPAREFSDLWRSNRGTGENWASHPQNPQNRILVRLERDSAFSAQGGPA
jgi:hypothetical protein